MENTYEFYTNLFYFESILCVFSGVGGAAEGEVGVGAELFGGFEEGGDVCGGDGEAGFLLVDDAGGEVDLGDGEEEGAGGAEGGEDFGGDGEDAGVFFEDGAEDVAGGEDLRHGGEVLVGEEEEIGEGVFFFPFCKPFSANAFGDDDDADLVVGGVLLGEAEEELGVMLHAEGAGVEVDEFVMEAVAAGPWVVFFADGEGFEGGPVGDDGDAVFGDLVVTAEDGGEVFGDGDDAVAGAELAAFHAAVVGADEGADEGDFFANEFIDGDAVEVLDPVDEFGGEGEGGGDDGVLGFCGGVPREDAFWLP